MKLTGAQKPRRRSPRKLQRLGSSPLAASRSPSRLSQLGSPGARPGSRYESIVRAGEKDALRKTNKALALSPLRPLSGQQRSPKKGAAGMPRSSKKGHPELPPSETRARWQEAVTETSNPDGSKFEVFHRPMLKANFPPVVPGASEATVAQRLTRPDGSVRMSFHDGRTLDSASGLTVVTIPDNLVKGGATITYNPKTGKVVKGESPRSKAGGGALGAVAAAAQQQVGPSMEEQMAALKAQLLAKDQQLAEKNRQLQAVQNVLQGGVALS